MPLNPSYIHINVPGVILWDYPSYNTTSGDIILSGEHGTADFPSGFTAATAATYNTLGLPVIYQFSFYKNPSNRDRAKAELTSLYNITSTDIFVNKKVSPTIVNNVANTSETYTSRLSEGIEVKITGTLENYDFTTIPTFAYIDLYGVSHTVTATVTTNGNTKTATAILDYVDFNTNIVVNGVYEPPTQITVTTTETNCAVTGLPQTVYNNSTLNLTATAASDYEFTTAPTFNYTDSNNVAQSVNFTIAANGKTATLNLNLATLDFGTTTATITATAAAVVYPTLTVDLTETNAVVSGLPNSVNTHTVLNLTATANTGYEFETAPQLNYQDENGTYQVYNFTVAQNKLTATLNLDLSTLNLNNVSTLHITVTAAAVVPQIEKYGTINVYRVTTNDLKDFALQRFFKLENSSQSYFQLVDLGNYVHSVKRLYCSVGETTPEVLKCGNYNTQIAVATPLSDTITLDCGTVTIPHKNNDVTDFNSEIKLFLPFFGFYLLPSDYVGKTISVQYIVNVITTNTIIKISCGGIVTECLECNISNDIVYKTNNENFINIPDFNMNVLKGLTPYVVLKYYNSENNKVYNNDCLRGTLSSFVGYLQITELTNFADSNITEKEFELLKQSLQNGVYILATNNT